VAVLMADTPSAHEALNEAVDAYAAKTGCETAILSGSSPGAMMFGHHNLT
jgi:hypothetical protein